MSERTLTTVQSLSAQVADEIRVWMTRRRMTGARLAELLDVSPAWVSYRINGQQEIGLDDMAAIAAALGTDWRELLPASERQPVATVTRLESRTLSRAGRRRRPNNPSLALTGRPPQRDDRAGTHPPNRGLRDSHTDESTRRPVITRTHRTDSAA